MIQVPQCLDLDRFYVFFNDFDSVDYVVISNLDLLFGFSVTKTQMTMLTIIKMY